MFGKKKKKKGTEELPPPTGVSFHVMPKVYRGHTGVASVVTKPVEKNVEKNVEKKEPAPVPKPTVVPPPPIAAPSAARKRQRLRRARRNALVVLGIFTILGIAIGTVLFLSPKESTPQVRQPDKEPVTEVPTKPIVRAPDSDHDNLSDAEEAIFETDVFREDTDGDGYSDGQEVANLYNPKDAVAESTIEATTAVARYANARFGYSLLYPRLWSIDAADPEGRTIRFRSETGEHIDVTVFENTAKQTAREWYEDRFPRDATIDTERLFFEHFEGVWTADRTNVYITPTVGESARAQIYALQYGARGENPLQFLTTFTMMFQSFTVGAVEVNGESLRM
jgi:hypothetical protein